jgi:hypothetical protein
MPFSGCIQNVNGFWQCVGCVPFDEDETSLKVSSGVEAAPS